MLNEKIPGKCIQERDGTNLPQTGRNVSQNYMYFHIITVQAGAG